MRTIKLMTDYDCHPLWEASPGQVGSIDPATLPITVNLRHALADWASRYDDTLDRDDPRRSGFANERDEASFKLHGLALAARLRDELGSEYTVVSKS
jgi:hypothetical protein